MTPEKYPPMRVVRTYAGKGTGETVYQTEDGRLWKEGAPSVNQTAPPESGVLCNGYVLREPKS